MKANADVYDDVCILQMQSKLCRPQLVLDDSKRGCGELRGNENELVSQEMQGVVPVSNVCVCAELRQCVCRHST